MLIFQEGFEPLWSFSIRILWTLCFSSTQMRWFRFRPQLWKPLKGKVTWKNFMYPAPQEFEVNHEMIWVTDFSPLPSPWQINIAIAGISPCSMSTGNTSTHSGPIFQPAMLAVSWSRSVKGEVWGKCLTKKHPRPPNKKPGSAHPLSFLKQNLMEEMLHQLKL